MSVLIDNSTFRVEEHTKKERPKDQGILKVFQPDRERFDMSQLLITNKHYGTEVVIEYDPVDDAGRPDIAFSSILQLLILKYVQDASKKRKDKDKLRFAANLHRIESSRMVMHLTRHRKDIHQMLAAIWGISDEEFTMVKEAVARSLPWRKGVLSAKFTERGHQAFMKFWNPIYTQEVATFVCRLNNESSPDQRRRIIRDLSRVPRLYAAAMVQSADPHNLRSIEDSIADIEEHAAPVIKRWSPPAQIMSYLAPNWYRIPRGASKPTTMLGWILASSYIGSDDLLRDSHVDNVHVQELWNYLAHIPNDRFWWFYETIERNSRSYRMRLRNMAVSAMVSYVNDGMTTFNNLSTLGLPVEEVNPWNFSMRNIRSAYTNHQVLITHRRAIRDAKTNEKAEKVLTGDPRLSPELEELRMKKGQEMMDASFELGHCIRQYIDRDEQYLFFRRGSVCAQVRRGTYTVVTCLDEHNTDTRESKEFKEYLRQHLPKVATYRTQYSTFYTNTSATTMTYTTRDMSSTDATIRPITSGGTSTARGR